MPEIIEYPTIVHQALEQFGAHFANEPERQNLAEYLTGLMVPERKTVSGISDEFAITTYQSCLNGWLTQVEWNVHTLNQKFSLNKAKAWESCGRTTSPNAKTYCSRARLVRGKRISPRHLVSPRVARANARFFTAAGLINELTEARDDQRLLRLRAQVLKQDLSVLDEVGFVPFSPQGGQL